MMMTVAAVTPSAAKLTFANNSPRCVITGTVPPSGDARPTDGNSCSKMMITPIPLMNPETTGYGMNLIREPTPVKPMPTWISPASTKVTTRAGRAASVLPMTSAMPITAAAVTTVIGPVGPLICTAVPPKIAAKKPMKIAPYNP